MGSTMTGSGAGAAGGGAGAGGGGAAAGGRPLPQAVDAAARTAAASTAMRRFIGIGGRDRGGRGDALSYRLPSTRGMRLKPRLERREARLRGLRRDPP